MLYQFRLHLYEFILGKKLSNSEEKQFNKASREKINKFQQDDVKDVESPRKEPTPAISNSLKKISSKKSLNNKPTKSESNTASTKSSDNTTKDLGKKITLWDLLKDRDRDSSWVDKNNDGSNDNLAKDDKAGDDDQSDSLRGPANPFLKTRISLLMIVKQRI